MYNRNIQESLFHLFLRRLTGQLNINSVCKSKRMLSNIGVREGKIRRGGKKFTRLFPIVPDLLKKIFFLSKFHLTFTFSGIFNYYIAYVFFLKLFPPFFPISWASLRHYAMNVTGGQPRMY